MNTFSIGACIRFGWETFKKRPWFFVGVTLFVMLLGWAPTVLQMMVGNNILGTVIIAIGSWAYAILLIMGQIALYMKAHDSIETVSISDLWRPHPFWKFVGAMFLLGLAIGLPIVIVAGIMGALMAALHTQPVIAFLIITVLAIAAILITLRFMFLMYIVMDTGLGPVASIKRCLKITKGTTLKMLLLWLAIVGLTLLGYLCLLVGAFVAIPVTQLALIHAYRTLSARAETPAAA